MKLLGQWALLALVLAGCQKQRPQPEALTETFKGTSLAGSLTNALSQEPPESLSDARRDWVTTIDPRAESKEPVQPAPVEIFRTIKYPAASGDLAAYVTPDPGDGHQHPSIVWITGGDCNSIGDVWSPAPRGNDQTAGAYRKAGIVMMFPSLRGGNDNPGIKEGFLGEVDDILAATDFLAKQTYVDPQRIYLGGHSTGGTLALLVAECSNRYRAVFSFGPVDDVAGYGADSGFLPFDMLNRREVELRSPGYWLPSIQSPVWVFEGSGSPSNIEALRAMAKASTNPQAHFIEVRAAGHFDVLAPTNELIATKILQDTAAASQLSLSENEVNQNLAR